QKTQNRSLVVKIRPRTSLHAGREAVPKSLRAKMRNQKQATAHILDKRDVVIEAKIPDKTKKLIPEPLPDKKASRKEEKPKALSERKISKKSAASGDYPVPEATKFPPKMLLSILERKLEYGQNTYLFDGSKSTRFDKHQRSGVLEASVNDVLPPILEKLEDIGWEIENTIAEHSSVVILMRLESATLGIAYAVQDGNTAISFIVVAKERFKKNIYNKIFNLR
ncbi:MAG: hypothetical protein ACTSQ0_07155, partial [Candidatus Heimdallarchaeota archaeon]